MKAEYRRDMYNNYMVFAESEGMMEDSYGLKMLIHNKIPGLLKLEVRVIDNQKQYYYDITSKQPVQWVFQKGQLSREQIKKIMEGIFYAIEGAREFLLNENDFLLNPEYLYINLASFQVELCYRPGYNHNIEEQLTCLIEYIMDKVDYKREDAVLLSYGLYKASRSKNCTIHELKRILNGTEELNTGQSPPAISIVEKTPDPWGEETENKTVEKETVRREEPVFEEEMAEETEVKKYAKVTWVYCGILTFFVLTAIAVCAKTGFFYSPINGKPEAVKAAALLGVAGAVEFLGLSVLLDEKKKIAVIKEQEVYVKTSYGEEESEDRKRKPFERELSSERDLNRKGDLNGKGDLNDKGDLNGKREFNDIRELSGVRGEYIKEGNTGAGNTEMLCGMEADMEERTVLLGGEEEDFSYILSPVNRKMYEEINLVEFPFFIGKLKTKVDFSISNKTISRFHAKLEKEGEDIFLVDLHSTNGTFLNGERILSNERRKVSLKDQISFANVMYILEKI